jgi:hypothetical protein
MTLVQDIITGLLDMTEGDTLPNLFIKAVPKKDYHTLWRQGEYDSCVRRSVVYEWWEDYLTENVKCPFLRNTLENALYDEDVYSILERIEKMYETYIKSVYPKK